MNKDNHALYNLRQRCIIETKVNILRWFGVFCPLYGLDYLQVAIEMIFIHIHVYHVMTHPNLTIILSAIIYSEERGAFHIFHETDV